MIPKTQKYQRIIAVVDCLMLFIRCEFKKIPFLDIFSFLPGFNHGREFIEWILHQEGGGKRFPWRLLNALGGTQLAEGEVRRPKSEG
ncbi:MAG: hypothetical protein R6X10_11280, partial [Desulfobacterales bacterium]